MTEHDERVRLLHMLDYAREVVTFTQGKTRQSLDDDLILERALRYSIGIIGEAATHISGEVREANPDIPWANIVGMRTFLFHSYFRVERDILWRTATENIPALIPQLERVIASLGSGQS